MNKLTREEFLGKYGSAEVVFDSYRKYTFAFRGDLPDGKILRVECGGNASEAYDIEVSAGFAEKVLFLPVSYAAVFNGDVALEAFIAD